MFCLLKHWTLAWETISATVDTNNATVNSYTMTDIYLQLISNLFNFSYLIIKDQCILLFRKISELEEMDIPTIEYSI